MKHYKIVYPDKHNNPIEEVLSEQDILDHYWEYWYEAMVRAGKRDLVSLDNCIKDFIVVNWAWEIWSQGSKTPPSPTLWEVT